MRFKILAPSRATNSATIGFCTRRDLGTWTPLTQLARSKLEAFSRHTRVLIMRVGKNQALDLNPLVRRGADCIFTDMDEWGSLPFLLRERDRLPLSFLLYASIIGRTRNFALLAPLIREQDTVIAPSQYAKNCLLSIWRKVPVRVVPPCLDVDRIRDWVARGAAASGDRCPTITHVSRYVHGKGLENLIECLPRILAALPRLRLNVIGELADERDLEILKRVKALRIQEHVTFLGYLSDAEKYQALARSDLLINLSIDPWETFGVVNIEAFSCGVPVICTRWAGFPEIVRNGQTGHLIDLTRDNGRLRARRDQVIRNVVGILRDHERLSKMKALARREASRFSCDRILPPLIARLRPSTGGWPHKWETLGAKTCLNFPRLYRPKALRMIKKYGYSRLSYSTLLRQLSEETRTEPSGMPAPGAIRLQEEMRRDVFELAGIPV